MKMKIMDIEVNKRLSLWELCKRTTSDSINHVYDLEMEYTILQFATPTFVPIHLKLEQSIS
jgi:hypothetical protein